MHGACLPERCMVRPQMTPAKHLGNRSGTFLPQQCEDVTKDGTTSTHCFYRIRYIVQTYPEMIALPGPMKG